MPDRSELVTLVLPSDAAALPLSGAALKSFESDALPEFLPRQRWFADKDAALGEIRLIDVVSVDSSAAVELAIIEIVDSQRLYFIPFAIALNGAEADRPPARAMLARVRRETSDGCIYDAFAADALPLALLDDVRAQRRRPSAGGGWFVAHAAPTLATLKLPVSPAVRRLTVEQSNTSVAVGEAVMIKGYRRVHRGPQPELEIARFLDAVDYLNTPALVGYVEYEHPDVEPMALCILQQFVASQGDGWDTTLAYLERFFDQPKPAPAAATSLDEDAFNARIRRLGQRTAELHVAFATPIGDPAFEPEPTTDADLEVWVAQAQATADSALTSLERGRDRVPADVREAAETLLTQRAQIMSRLAIPSLGSTPISKTRYHGDFHLGQVLAVDADFMIVDFEGEPGRDAAIRRRKSSPLRDVAGMLRSLNYAAVAGLRNAAPQRTAGSSTLAPLAQEWERRTVGAFLDGYRAAIAGCPAYPSSPQQAQNLLDLFVLEKAFYELSYELANRPSWLGIPLQGIRAILDAGQYASTVQ